MQHTQQLFLEALKAALKNEQVEWNNKLEAQEWMDLFRMAEVHQILPMIYEAVYRSPAAGQADPQILAPAKAQMVRTVIMQTQKTGEFEPLALQISERERNLSVSGERDRVQEHLSESGLSDIRR